MGRHCKTCGISHEKPTGKGCTRKSNAADMADSNDDKEKSEMLLLLQELNKKMQRFEGRLTQLEGEETEKRATEEPAGREPVQQAESQMTEPPLATPDTVRADPDIMAEVDEKLASWGLLDEDQAEPTATAQTWTWSRQPKKSGAVSKGTDIIKKYIDWPHFHIKKGPNKTSPEIKDITSEEFTLGFLRMLEDPESKFDSKRMLVILRDIMEDTVDFGWASARSFYAELGLQVEKRQLSWSDEQKIMALRFTHYRTVTPNSLAGQQKNNNTQRGRACAAFQKGSCDQVGDHGPFKHICEYCLRTRNMTFPHPETECRTKRHAGSKNE